MSYVTILWSVAGAVALLLGTVHALVWIMDRQARANAYFALIAFAVIGIAATELEMMHASTAAQWAAWVRWCHIPIFFLYCGLLLFVRADFGAGRRWLVWTIIGIRAVILAWNFAAYPNFNFARVLSLEHVSFLGEQVATVGDSAPRPWQVFATASGVLCLFFIVDAWRSAWHMHPETRRKLRVVGTSAILSVALAYVHTQAVIWGLLHWPIVIAPAFSIMLTAMAFELSRDLLHATRLARDLRESERRLELAANAAGLGLWTWDAARKRIWATSNARAIFQLPTADPIAVGDVAPLIHPDDAARLREALRAALRADGEQAVQFRVFRADGSTRWILARGCAEPRTPGEPVLLRGVLRDVTDQKKIEDEADELRRELAHAGRVTMLGQLASALAHELKQPLGAILRNSEAAQLLLAADQPDLPELRAIISDVHADDRRASEVIDRLRSLLGRRNMEFQPIAVASLVQDVRSLVRFDAAARHVVFDCAIDPALPPISGDKVHLSQVLINLIINGMDASIESSDSRRRVVLQARALPNSLIELSVSDSGPGIPSERMKRIFEPFFTTKATGMGMGLCVSRTIVEAHGGRLCVENNADGGATFRFALPIAEEVAA
jgi:PAS domain S-box-containing protein